MRCVILIMLKNCLHFSPLHPFPHKPGFCFLLCWQFQPTRKRLACIAAQQLFKHFFCDFSQIKVSQILTQQRIFSKIPLFGSTLITRTLADSVFLTETEHMSGGVSNWKQFSHKRTAWGCGRIPNAEKSVNIWAKIFNIWEKYAATFTCEVVSIFPIRQNNGQNGKIVPDYYFLPLMAK